MSRGEFEAQLTLKDRLNFPYLLANQILTFQKAILNMEYSEREIKEAIEGFVHLIPENWKDDKWKKEIGAAETVEKVDNRKEWCGRKIGKPKIEEHKTFDYYKMFQACINLLDRKKMLSRTVLIEELESIDFDAVTEDALRKSDLPSE
jgi:hypothetical protein